MNITDPFTPSFLDYIVIDGNETMHEIHVIVGLVVDLSCGIMAICGICEIFMGLVETIWILFPTLLCHIFTLQEMMPYHNKIMDPRSSSYFMGTWFMKLMFVLCICKILATWYALVSWYSLCIFIYFSSFVYIILVVGFGFGGLIPLSFGLFYISLVVVVFYILIYYVLSLHMGGK